VKASRAQRVESKRQPGVANRLTPHLNRIRLAKQVRWGDPRSLRLPMRVATYLEVLLKGKRGTMQNLLPVNRRVSIDEGATA